MKDRLLELIKFRAESFSRGYEIAHSLAQRHPFVIVGDSLFVHGGLLPEHIEYGLEQIETESREWMMDRNKTHGDFMDLDAMPVYPPWWTRDLVFRHQDRIESEAEEVARCSKIARVLSKLRVRRMIIGHSITDSAQIEFNCDQKLIRIDVALSGALWQDTGYVRPLPYQILKIETGADGSTTPSVVEYPVTP